jgi:truncated hemoglobin YjbI
VNTSHFMRKTTSWVGLLMLVLAADSAFAQAEPTKPAKAKRVFTNDDLSKFGEKYGPDTAPTRVSAPKDTTDAGKPYNKPTSEPKTTTSEERSKWVGKLKEAETALQKAKADQAKYSGALEKFEQKHRDAQTDFQKNLTQNQVADSLNNLTRATEEVKQAEEKKSKLLAEAEQKGFKPSDLQETPEAPAQQK